MNHWSVIIAALAACSCNAEPGSALGRVVLALDADTCARYCAAEVRANIYREGDDLFPIGPAAQEACGEALTFASLPAGTRVHVRVEVFDPGGELRFEGESDPVTVVADGSTTAVIHVTAIDPPTLASVTPDPVIVANGAVAVSLGGELDGALGSADGVSLDDEPLVVDWEAGSATVPTTAHAGDLIATRCGVPSNAWPLRVVGAALGVADVPQAPGCAGRRVVALVADGDDVLVAFACDAAGDSYVERFVSDGVCPLDGSSIWKLSARPSALAAGWVGLESGGVASFDLQATSVGAAQGSGVASALVDVAGHVYAIVDGALARLDQGLHAVAGVDAGLALVALAGADDSALVLASSGDEARVVEVAVGSDTVITRSVPECVGPRAFAASAEAVVMACDARVVVLDRGDGNRKVLDEVASGVALDPRGDIAFTWRPGERVAVVDVASGSVLHAWSGAPAGLALGVVPIQPGDRSLRLVAPGASDGALGVWTPYDGGGPCP